LLAPVTPAAPKPPDLALAGQGAIGVNPRFCGRPLTRGQKLSNKALAAVRAPVEHGFAHLKNWRVLGKVRTDPTWATALVRALLV
ncbi:IS5/IS1182 family transposase, partial [Streptomyces sp. NPDC048279]